MKSRKNNRLTEFDYSQNGAYFMTICTKDRQNLFWDNNDFVGEVIGRPQHERYKDNNISERLNNVNVGAVIGRPQYERYLNRNGEIIKFAIEQISIHYEGVLVEKYVVMPNHVHLILLIDRNEINGRPMTAPTISWIINQFKGYCTKQIGFPIWQKSFYDHIIRNQADYDRIWRYIDENPIKWELDEYYIKE